MKLLYPGSRLLIQLTAAFLIIFNVANSQGTTNFTFNNIPYSDPDFIGPGRGAEQWHNSSARIPNPTESQPVGTENSLDVYYRFQWALIEGATQGSYNWGYFDNLIRDAIDNGQKLSFGIMTHNSDGGVVSYGGGSSSYPQYLHNLMQAEAPNSRDWLSGNGVWVPNWNSPNYLGRLRALHVALNNYIMTASYTPSGGPRSGQRVNYRDAIYCIDIRGYGNWGEWHSGEICDFNGYPAGRQPTNATFKELIDLHTEVFQNWPLVMMVAGYDGGYTGISLFGVPAEVSYYALTARNAWGAVGYRRDQWGATDGYLNSLMAGNNQTYNGSATFKTYILDKYKTAPITGEPYPGNLDMADLENQVSLYHATSVGNGNYGPYPGAISQRNNIRAAFKRAGYRIELTGGSAVTSPSSFTVNLNWRNVGVAPTYENWNVSYELRNGATVVWTGNSTFKPKLFLPSPNATTATDVFNRTGIPQGTYSLYVIIKDPSGYRSPLPLAITGRGNDGAYLLNNNVTIPPAGGNQAPVANAGANQTITLPASSANLNGSTSSDADGTIASYQWQQINGPSTSALSATNTANITVSNLQAGTYTYRLTVTDNGGATDNVTVTVTVNAAPVNQAPLANAGASRTVTLPVSTATLNGNGTDADGTIAVYQWQQVSGPSASTLSATNTADITVSNLQAGVYTYRLTVTDNDNATATDEVTVTVSVAPNQAPVANAGANRAITLPTSSVGLNGSSSSDPDGTIASYQWQQLSGPSASALSATNTANITASNLQAGTYIYRLTVTDNDGSTDTDQVTITVNNAPVNQAPTARGGANSAITAPANSTTLNGNGSTDADGTIASYLWQQVSGPSASTLSATNIVNITVSNLQVGVYTYRLTVTDNDGAADTDDVTVTVNNAPVNQAPTARAGANKAITLPANSTTLNGNTSSDADGTVASYLWQQVSGPSASTLSATNIDNITVSNLQVGVYTYRLTVTDNDGATDADVVTVTVNARTNRAPTANAGPNRAITRPSNSTSLNGSGSADADGTIASYQWQQVSGPNGTTFSATNTANINIGNLQAGIYTFRLTVTDNDNATATDEVTVTVNNLPNQAPIANAGTNRIITLPTSTASLTGSGIDADGTIASYLWQQISGPSASSLSATNTATITVSNLQAGVYIYRLTVRDNGNAAGTDNVTITVNAAAANKAPVANAGTNRTITLPTNSTTLSGAASSDPDGTIASYLWQQISGPSASVLSATNTAGITVSNLQAGVYTYRLTVRDNKNAAAAATVTVTVNNVANKAPIAKSGPDQVVLITANTAILTAEQSSDPDGRITRYRWQQVSGPSASAFSSTTDASVTVSNLRLGDYVYRVTVTDDDNATATTTVKVAVIDNFRNYDQPFALYPNPAQDIVNIRLLSDKASRSQINIYDMAGKQVLAPVIVNKPAGAFTTTIDVARLKPGSYVVYITAFGVKKMTTKFIKL